MLWTHTFPWLHGHLSINNSPLFPFLPSWWKSYKILGGFQILQRQHPLNADNNGRNFHFPGILKREEVHIGRFEVFVRRKICMDKTEARALVRKIDPGDLTSERGFIHRYPSARILSSSSAQ